MVKFWEPFANCEELKPALKRKAPQAEAQGAIYTKYLKERHRRRGARENNI
nr:MAG TPA: hypothetical protein [Caudoviricetes sp.]